MREGVKEHNMHIEPKSYKYKLLGKLVVQHHIFFPFLSKLTQEFYAKNLGKFHIGP